MWSENLWKRHKFLFLCYDFRPFSTLRQRDHSRARVKRRLSINSSKLELFVSCHLSCVGMSISCSCLVEVSDDPVTIEYSYLLHFQNILSKVFVHFTVNCSWKLYSNAFSPKVGRRFAKWKSGEIKLNVNWKEKFTESSFFLSQMECDVQIMCYDVSRWCKICFQSFFLLPIFLLYAQWVDESVIKFTTLRLTTLQVSFLLVIPSFPIWMHKMHKSASRWIALTIEMNVKLKYFIHRGVYGVAGFFQLMTIDSELFIVSERIHKTPPTH